MTIVDELLTDAQPEMNVEDAQKAFDHLAELLSDMKRETARMEQLAILSEADKTETLSEVMKTIAIDSGYNPIMVEQLGASDYIKTAGNFIRKQFMKIDEAWTKVGSSVKFTTSANIIDGYIKKLENANEAAMYNAIIKAQSFLSPALRTYMVAALSFNGDMSKGIKTLCNDFDSYLKGDPKADIKISLKTNPKLINEVLKQANKVWFTRVEKHMQDAQFTFVSKITARNIKVANIKKDEIIASSVRMYEHGWKTILGSFFMGSGQLLGTISGVLLFNSGLAKSDTEQLKADVLKDKNAVIKQLQDILKLIKEAPSLQKEIDKVIKLSKENFKEDGLTAAEVAKAYRIRVDMYSTLIDLFYGIGSTAINSAKLEKVVTNL